MFEVVEVSSIGALRLSNCFGRALFVIGSPNWIHLNWLLKEIVRGPVVQIKQRNALKATHACNHQLFQPEETDSS